MARQFKAAGARCESPRRKISGEDHRECSPQESVRGSLRPCPRNDAASWRPVLDLNILQTKREFRNAIDARLLTSPGAETTSCGMHLVASILRSTIMLRKTIIALVAAASV